MYRKHSIMALENSGFGTVCQGPGASFSSGRAAGSLPEAVYERITWAK